MKISRTLGLLAAAALTLPAVPAAAAVQTDSAAAQRDCFFVSQWRGWTAPNEDTLLLRMRNKDVYRVELSAGSSSLLFSGNHLISEMRGSSTVCSALDLDLAVSSGAISQPLIARSIVKLTPEEVAALPPKHRP